MLPGIRIQELKKLPDERGSFCELFRSDWGDLLEGDTIAQSNMSVSYPGIIRAWHRHSRGGRLIILLCLEGQERFVLMTTGIIPQPDEYTFELLQVQKMPMQNQFIGLVFYVARAARGLLLGS